MRAGSAAHHPSRQDSPGVHRHGRQLVRRAAAAAHRSPAFWIQSPICWA